ncbi:hypothetical protein VitviT2T_019542 [Vitis vinifera]|uniref:Uncharacterized protein n=1 Tax=Vitis vinifera TaxID=29760 RepID=A0ABY9D1L8_VITVI|nr:hypothetical protein VitviT2T_019542 [Vitis vinifera]
MLATGGEVLLERLPAAGKGGQGVVWQLQELSEQAVRDIWRVRVFQRERGEEKNQSGKLQGIPLAWRSRERGRSPERVAIREEGLKLAINLLNNKGVDEAFRAHINLKALRFGM